MLGILLTNRGSLSFGCEGGSGALLNAKVGASAMGSSSSDLMGVETWEMDEIFRSGVGAGPLGSFFLCERLLVLAGFGVEVPEAERMAGVEGVG